LLDLKVPIDAGRRDALVVIEKRIDLAERTHALLVDGFRGHDFSAPCENGKTGRTLLDEAVADILLWRGAREFVLGLPWAGEEVRP